MSKESGQTQQRESLEDEQQIFHKKKETTTARRVEQTSVRYSLKAITQNCRGEIGMGRPRKKKRKEIEGDARGLGFVVEILPTRRGDERAKAG